MIWWIYGPSGAGKSTLAKELVKGIGAIHLDGDDMRSSISADLGFSEEDRRENNIRIAKLAVVLEKQGHSVVVSTICPYESLRDQVYFICKCRFIKVEAANG